MKYIFFFLFSEFPNVVPINSIAKTIINIANNGSPESATIEYTILHLHNYILY
jgi:hypothetical protein